MSPLLFALSLLGCSDPVEAPSPEASEPAPDALPAPPFALAEAPPAGWEGWNLTLIPERMLEETAHRYAAEGKWGQAALAQYQYLKGAERKTGRYNLACYLARAGQLDGAIYWLQEAVVHEGVDPSWAGQDIDLVPLHQDARWATLQGHLEAAARYWSAHGPPAVKVYVPKESDPKVAQPALILLHGAASEPSNIFSAMLPAMWSNPLAMVSVSGTNPRGPHSFLWAEDPTRDHARVQAALAEAAPQLTVDRAKLAPVGFSQGALVALDLLAAHPADYAGAIAFSPSGITLGSYEAARGDLTGKHVVIVVGEGEDAAAVKAAERAADVFRRKGAEVVHRVTPRQTDHGLPLDFQANFPAWSRFALGGPLP